MARILCIGIATLDIINQVESFPEEDAEVRATEQTLRRGGNATNTLVLLGQLGHQAYWAGNYADDSASAVILQDLENYQVDYTAATKQQNSTTPTSYITLNQKNGSRTIVHYRNLDEYSSFDFIKLKLDLFDWLHFEGRNIQQSLLMLEYLEKNYPKIPISIECEKKRDNIEKLFPHANLLIFSRHYCQQTGFTSAEQFLQSLPLTPGQQIIVTWGDKGAYLRNEDVPFMHFPAEKIINIKDSIGAGDSFNAGLIDALSRKHTINNAIRSANQLAGYKLQRYGFNIDGFNRVNN